MKQAALLGAGVVGAGVAEMMEANAAYLEKSVGEPVGLKYILEPRDCTGQPWADKVVRDFSVIENDPEVSVVAECIGGVGVAYDFVKRALLAGKSAVTSNKQLIAEKGLELLSIAKEKGVFLLFEASVGGGIPLIRPLTNCLAANRIEEVHGIVNGTTNYILTQMFGCGQDFDSALKEAQRLGYAEADPSADVDGIDALRKICILADLCFGSNLPPEKVPAEGIRGVTAADVAFADKLGCSIKLLASAKRVDGERFTAFVAPMLVKKGTLLADVGGVMNAVVVTGNAVGDCLFYGAGAGRMPTASAVVADVIDAMRRGNGRKFIDWGPERPELWVDPREVPERWYVRYQNGCASEIVDQCLSDGGECAGITAPMTQAELEKAFGSTELLSAFRVQE
ncbi:MAG: homoserine dehydrogenase [Oscillospiraceae bacterium]|nr:homoserine dehydrogenase [Oscillospiraceae bacterium]